MNKEHLLVSKIKDGTVIDHIPAGKALTVLKILGIKGDEGFRVAIVMNVASEKLQKKDIVKIEGRELKGEEVNKIALIAPTATINIIRDYKVALKVKVELPEVIEDIIRCPNPHCITNRSREPIKAKFKLISKQPVALKCMYCGRYVRSEQIVSQLSK